MGLTLDFIPGYSDLSDDVLAEINPGTGLRNPALGIHLAEIASNAAFGECRLEVSVGNYKNGDTVPLPVSPIDGYSYSRSELIYYWFVASTTNPAGWISAPDALWYCDWLVDQSTGDVSIDEFYLAWARSSTATNDGLLTVVTIAQRQRTTLLMATSPTWDAITSSWIGLDKPYSQQLAQALNRRAKFSVVATEGFYLGEFYNGQTVPPPTSPTGHVYSYAECKFMPSPRWTPAGNVSPLQQPSNQLQLGPMSFAVSSVGVVSTTVDYATNGGEGTTSTTDGRVAVFAFCTRSGGPGAGSISPAADVFVPVDLNTLLPGNFDEYPTLANILENVDQAALTPEFFGPTIYSDGDTIPVPTSAIDGHVYVRSELTYVPAWSVISPGAFPAGGGDHDRLVLFFGSVDQGTGVVGLTVWRLAPGGPDIHAPSTNMKVSVLVVARRQADPQLNPVAPTTNPSTNSGTVTTDPWSMLITDDLSAAANGSNTTFTLSQTPRQMLGVVWETTFHVTDYSVSGTTLTTNFKDDNGNSIAPLAGDKFYALYFV